MGVTFSNVILSNSKAGLEAYEITSPKAKVIWNGVRLERFEKTYDKLKKREELNIRTKFILVMIAAFSELKDYDLFLDVAKGIAELRSDVTLIGVGDGHEFVRIRKRITDEGIHNVILTGKQKDVESIIAASDVGLLCTYSEGISNFIIECMALQKPVISTDITGASKEIILEGKTGYCIRRNANEIVILINSLLDNESLRTSMGKTGKERIYEHFSIERMGKEFELLYENTLLTHRKR
jgi:glycosyltransferase involved in cell wall biosynthesis